MINVIAFIRLKEARVPEYIEIVKANIPHVIKEEGCLEYRPTIDHPTDLPPQALDSNVVTIIEKWRTIEDLLAHFSAPHMLAYREKVKNIVDKISIKVLTDV
ncbi:MAG: antibiotic biosynthesis monooxygenase [Desulfobacteraceae bacterium]|nr:antibiotic biosynthesis monooxygenase [Desulfobacteraceae bacterium]MBC2750806.1 antibiotic biosynthesis monooxygenase [Desulfobacteraceae bacterium]